MSLKIAINGFGRIGRLVLRALLESHRKDLQVVAINDLAPLDMSAYLLKNDSIHGRLPQAIQVEGDMMSINGHAIKMLSLPQPEKLPWKDMNIDIVMECSGRFTSKETASQHLQAGAKRVLISAPADNADLTVVYGINHQELNKTHRVVSNASCTTNCLAPVAFIADQLVGIEAGYMTTIHAYTGDQSLVDTAHKDMRRARAAGLSMIPTSTGAARAVGLVLPSLNGKLDGTAIRVPTSNVSVVDFKFVAKRPTGVAELNKAFKEAAEGSLKEILSAVEEPLVSIDFNHSPYSSNFDLTQTQVVGGTFCRVLSWYDNEWGFSNRMLDTAVEMGKHL
jgi:glyceraldehyde 3-phosphate dehydrogenase